MCFEEATPFPVTPIVTTRMDLASIFQTGSHFPREFEDILVSKDILTRVTCFFSGREGNGREGLRHRETGQENPDCHGGAEQSPLRIKGNSFAIHPSPSSWDHTP